MERDVPYNWGSKKAEVALFISGNIDFNTKTVIGDEGHCIMINRSTQQGI